MKNQISKAQVAGGHVSKGLENIVIDKSFNSLDCTTKSCYLFYEMNLMP